MDRRVVLVGCVTALTGLSGCLGDDDAVDQRATSETPTPATSEASTPATSEASTPVTSEASTPATSEATTVDDARPAFERTVREAVDGDPSFSFEGDTWSVSYHYDRCCAEDRLRSHQVELAKQFVAVQPDGVTVALTTTHECQAVEWEVPPDVARRYRAGGLSEAELASHIEGSSERTETC